MENTYAVFATYVNGPTFKVAVALAPDRCPLSNHIAFAIMVKNNKSIQQDNLCTRVKLLFVGL